MPHEHRVETVVGYWQRWMAKFPTVRFLGGGVGGGTYVSAAAPTLPTTTGGIAGVGERRGGERGVGRWVTDGQIDTLLVVWFACLVCTAPQQQRRPTDPKPKQAWGITGGHACCSKGRGCCWRSMGAISLRRWRSCWPSQVQKGWGFNFIRCCIHVFIHLFHPWF